MKPIVIACGLVVALGAVDGRAQSGYDLFQKALVSERANGNLREAIQLYERIVKQFAADRALVARALIRIADCYEKLGQRDAAKVYERVVREFSDQAESVTLARARLTILQSPALQSAQTVRQIWTGDGVDALGAPSPDGRYLTYTDWDTGDLSIRDLVQGSNRRLTNTGGWDVSGNFAEFSVWSPDGRQIAYAWFVEKATPLDGTCLCRYELRVVSLSGADANRSRIVHKSADTIWIQPAAWTPDGRQVLVVRQTMDRTHALELMSVADGSRRLLKSLGVHAPAGVALSPDGRFVAYGWPSSPDNPQRDVFLIALDDARDAAIVRSPGHDRSPMWTADGSHLMFISDRSGADALWRVPFAEGRALGAPVMIMSTPAAFGGLMGTTRNGSLFYWTGAQNTNIYLTDLDANASGKTPEWVAIERFLNSNNAPVWSPDGNLLAYLSRRGWGDTPQSTVLVIHSMITGDDREVPLRARPLDRVAWFPDGTAMLVAALDQQRRVAYYRVDPATGSMDLLTTAKGHSVGTRRPQLSADGNAIFYIDNDRQMDLGNLGFRMMRFDLTTRSASEVAGFKVNVTSFAVSPDGAQVAYLYNDQEGTSILEIVAVAGGQIRELTRHKDLSPARFSGLTWTKDQRYVLYVKPSKTVSVNPSELWKAPVNGGPAQPTGISMPGLVRLPAIHPNGRQLAFASIGGGTAPAIWTVENLLPSTTNRTGR